MTVPTVSKKSESMMEKIVSSATVTPRRPKTSTFTPSPRVEKSGKATMWVGSTATPGRVHTCPPPSVFTTMARAVVAAMPTRSAARTCRATSSTVSRRPTTATATRGVASGPSVTGVPTPAFTIPPLISPMKRMKSPIPTEMARFWEMGIALATASRRPTSTSSVMATPSRKMTPMAVGHGSL
jgi:hypothetical protein